MKRFIAQFHKGGLPELYVVVDTSDGGDIIGDPKTYHKANDEAQARNDGTYQEGMGFEAMADALQAAFPTPLTGDR